MRLSKTLFSTVFASAHLALNWDQQKVITSPNNVINTTKLQSYVHKASDLVKRFREEVGCPGISVCVSYSGRTLYKEGIGYADVEQLVPVHEDTLFRIASISKTFASLLVGRLIDQGKLDLDEDIRQYLPEFPKKTIDNSYAKITVRSILNHTSGIRGYREEQNENKQTDYPEMFSTAHYKTTSDALKMFQNDLLVHKPGQEYTYSTFAFTLLSNIIEKIVFTKGPIFNLPQPTIPNNNLNKKLSNISSNNSLPKWASIDKQLLQLFQFLNLNHTKLEYHEEIKPMLAKPYYRDDKGRLRNSPIVDNSYKWIGGGILSTSSDLVCLANHLSFIYMNWFHKNDIMKRETLKKLWTVSAIPSENKFLPGLGWFLGRRSGQPANDAHIYPDRLYALHTGGAVGCTTVLLISLPCIDEINSKLVDNYESYNDDIDKNKSICSIHPLFDLRKTISIKPPISVAVLTNLQDANGISQLAIDLAELFLNFTLED